MSRTSAGCWVSTDIKILVDRRVGEIWVLTHTPHRMTETVALRRNNSSSINRTPSFSPLLLTIKNTIMKELSLSFQVHGYTIFIDVWYQPSHPENYGVIKCLYGTQNVTDFYNLCVSQGDDMFYPQIVEAIAKDIYKPTQVTKEPTGAIVASWSGANHLNNTQTH